MNKTSFKGFYRFSDLERQKYMGPKGHLREQFNIVQKVQGDGVEYEFMISFYEFRDRLAARAEIFEDAFVAFELNSELFTELSKCKTVSPDEIEELLVSLGYRNLTEEEAKNDGK